MKVCGLCKVWYSVSLKPNVVDYNAEEMVWCIIHRLISDFERNNEQNHTSISDIQLLQNVKCIFMIVLYCIVLYWILHYLLSIYGGLFVSWLFLWLYCIVVLYCIEFCTIYCLSMVVCLFPGCFYDCIVLLYCIVLNYALSFAIIEIIKIAMHTLSLMHADMETSLSAVNPSCCVCYMKPLQIPGIVQGYIIYVINIYLKIIDICEALIFLG